MGIILEGVGYYYNDNNVIVDHWVCLVMFDN